MSDDAAILSAAAAAVSPPCRHGRSRSNDDGTWSSPIRIAHARYTVLARAIDDAGNRSRRVVRLVANG